MSRILDAVGQGAEFIHQSLAPYDLDGGYPVPSKLNREIHAIEAMANKEPFSLSDLPAYFDAAKNLTTVGIDDRKLLLEKLLTLMSRLPLDSTFSKKLQEYVIDILYKDLPHPPSGYLTLPAPANQSTIASGRKGVNYAYRTADGSNYSSIYPTIGMAKTPYARSVPSLSPVPRSALPDAGLVFDTLLKRDKFLPHPGGISSFFFAMANLIIHSIFNTDHQTPTQNNASSYLDLSVLYGTGQDMENKVRMHDGTGRIWPDVFGDSRIMLMPPSTGALLILFSRNHNYIAERILAINENRNLKTPPPTDEVQLKLQDDEIFSRARLVNCGFFMQVILRDYVGAILGLVRDNTAWRLDPLSEFRQLDHEFAERGQGNACSIEFNILYRWHATLSDPDAKWIDNELTQMFQKPSSELNTHDFTKKIGHLTPKSDVRKWPIGGLQRDAEGRFNDAELANILITATQTPAGAFRARGTPEAMRVVEILGIEQSRQWGTCSLNEFRKFLGLKQYADFKEWNKNPEIYQAAESLYGHIDHLELHVGMQAEETKEPMPGAGLCPGYTISRAILADAVALTRGDRFLTIDMTPWNLTSWGYQDCQVEIVDGSYGGVLTKLLYRHLPEFYPVRSAYAHFPFLTPDYMKQEFGTNPDVKEYDWSRPVPSKGPVVVVDTCEEVKQIRDDPRRFHAVYSKRIKTITAGFGPDQPLMDAMFFSDAALNDWKDSFLNTTRRLLREKKIRHINSPVSLTYVDVVKDVLNLVPVFWIANEIIGLPVKTPTNPHRFYREQDLYQQFADVANYVFVNEDPGETWALRVKATSTAQDVIGGLTDHLGRASRSIFSVTGATETVTGLVSTILSGKCYADIFIERLLKAGGDDRNHHQLAASVFAEIVPTAALFSLYLTHAVNYYLDTDTEEKQAARQSINKNAGVLTKTAEATLLAYIYIALRNDPPLAGIYRTAVEDTTIGGKNVIKGQRVFASIAKANAGRPGVPLGFGAYGLVSTTFFENIAPKVFGAIFGLKNLRRAPHESGKLNRFSRNEHGTEQTVYIDNNGKITPWPASLIVQYEDDAH